jgi:hypothetical protein
LAARRPGGQENQTTRPAKLDAHRAHSALTNLYASACAPVAQGIEQRFPKPCAAGSNPAGGTTRPPDVALPNRRFRARVDCRRPLKMHDHADVRKFDSVHRASANAPSMTGRRGGSATPRMQINLECGCGRASGVRHFRGPRDRTRHSNLTLLAEGVGFEPTGQGWIPAQCPGSP